MFLHMQIVNSDVATGVRGAGPTGRHLLGAAKGRKTPKIKKNHVKIHILTTALGGQRSCYATDCESS